MSSIQSKVIQAGNGQDYACSGEGLYDVTGRPMQWTIVADGHGANGFIDLVRRTDFSKLVIQPNPMDKIIEYFKSFNGTYRDQIYYSYGNNRRISSGSTFILVKIYDNNFNGESRMIETYSIGDSRCAIYIDGIQEYISTPHNMNNPKEVERLKDRGIIQSIEPDPVPTIAGATKLVGKQCQYNMFEDGTRLAPTQSLGHDEVTGFEPEYFMKVFSEHQQVRVVAGSDGFWDMHFMSIDPTPDSLQDLHEITTLSASDLSEKALRRWSQLWNYHYLSERPEIIYKTRFPPNGYDDISVVVWENTKTKTLKEEMAEGEEYVRKLLSGEVDNV